MLLRALAIAVLVAAFPTGVGAQDADGDGAWLVEADKIACVLENLAAYTHSATDPVLIILDTCPETGATLSDFVFNSALPSVERNEDGTELMHALVFSKAELACLDPGDVSIEGEFATVVKTPCAN